MGASAPKWYLVQVDLEATNEVAAHNNGTYRVRWWVAYHNDAKIRPPRHCRFWPEIWDMRPDLTLGPRRVVCPGKAEAMLDQRTDLAWYQLDVDLPTTAIVGPFSFVRVTTPAGHDNNRVADTEWDGLLQRGPGMGVDIWQSYLCHPTTGNGMAGRSRLRWL